MAALEEHDFTHGDNKTTHYVAAGPKDGPLIILVHGWPGIAKLWKPQLLTFASLGFRAVAPDMPGYGKSTARKVAEDYKMETVNLGMVALLDYLKRDKAIWIGHDWGCGCVWSFVAHYPEKTIAAAGLCVPYGVLELGLDNLLATVDRNIYPESEFPYGQWSYMKFYETDFEKATAFYDSDIRAVTRALRARGNPEGVGKPALLTANVSKDGGWFGGAAKADPKWRDIPLENTVFESEESFDEFASAMEKTGWWGGDAYYINHAANRKYSLEKAKNDGNLDMPVLFIHATYDTVCATDNPKICKAMRQKCENLKETVIDASHWVNEEKPEETSAAIARWLVEDVGEVWPKAWGRL